MRKTFALAIAAAVGLTGITTGAESAPAQQAPSATSIDQVRAGALAAMNAGDLQTVRDHRGGRGGRNFRGGRHFGGRNRSFGNRRYYGGGRRYNRGGHGAGGALAAGAIGLAAGAIIAGAANRGSAGSGSCASRFRSYNPRTGTYTAYDGRQIACP